MIFALLALGALVVLAVEIVSQRIRARAERGMVAAHLQGIFRRQQEDMAPYIEKAKSK